MAYQQGPPGWPPGYGPPPGYGWPQAVPNSGAATASLVFGILGILGGWCVFGVPCFIAIICGHIGLSETKDGQRTGHGSAVAGLILGYLGAIPMAALTFAMAWGELAPGGVTP